MIVSVKVGVSLQYFGDKMGGQKLKRRVVVDTKVYAWQRSINKKAMTVPKRSALVLLTK